MVPCKEEKKKEKKKLANEGKRENEIKIKAGAKFNQNK
jgi:hypothetical protein